jgi:hypothetical protein
MKTGPAARVAGKEVAVQLTPEDFEAVIEGLITAAGHDGALRRSPRVALNGVATALRLPDEGNGVLTVQVRDVSPEGVCFTHHLPFTTGQRLKLMLPRANGEPPIPVECQVRHCRSMGADLYVMGAQFEPRDEPPGEPCR